MVNFGGFVDAGLHRLYHTNRFAGAGSLVYAVNNTFFFAFGVFFLSFI